MIRITLVLATLAGLAVPAAADPWGTVGMGDFATCAITSGKHVACWGLGSDREKYPPDIVRSKTPKVMAGISDAVRVAVGYRYACVLDGKGAVTCWGMLDPDADQKGGTKPEKIAGVSDAVEIGVGRYEACARTRAGEVWCWGQVDGQKLELKPQKVAQDTARMAVGNGSLCTIGKDGKVTCSGGAASGANGDSLTDWKPMPKLGAASDVVAQVGLACAVHADGTAACDGDKAEDLAAGVAAQKHVDKLWATDDSSFACALSAGKLQCWGESYAAQLGDGKIEKDGRRGPVEVKLPGKVVDATVGPANACARLATGKLYCWGGADGWVIPTTGGDIVKKPIEVKLPK